jgi:hypothetical protein
MIYMTRIYTVMMIGIIVLCVCAYAFAAQGGGKAKAVAGATASGQFSAGISESAGGEGNGGDVTAYKGKDELKEEEAMPVYPDAMPENPGDANAGPKE